MLGNSRETKRNKGQMEGGGRKEEEKKWGRAREGAAGREMKKGTAGLLSNTIALRLQQPTA